MAGESRRDDDAPATMITEKGAAASRVTRKVPAAPGNGEIDR